MNRQETNGSTASDRQPSIAQPARRDFLKSVGAVSVGWAAAAGTARAASPAETARLPQVPFGKHRISRLVCGSNTFNAGSHLSVFVNEEMRAYYQPEQIMKTLRRFEELGGNCWQISGVHNLDLYRRYLDEGGQMQIISLGRDPKELPLLAKAGCLGVAHHGEVSDQLLKAGKLDEMHDFLKAVRDSGMMVGVSTHMPAVVDAVESKGWDIDYYMTCIYERHRTDEELKKLLGCVPLPPREVYLREDPPRMFKAIQATKRTCLAFKILAAGRLSDRKEWVDQAFRETFAGIKTGDAVIVGIYDRYSDQLGENASLVRKYGAAKGA
ncbi:MAG: hypothetical protein KJZ87_18520 [Thermoguttaceae bacterium]|nr:hypothetical protein [Thermoguttaceae bacterium]